MFGCLRVGAGASTAWGGLNNSVQNDVRMKDNDVLYGTNDGTLRARKRYKRQTGKTRALLGFLHPRFQYPAVDLQEPCEKHSKCTSLATAPTISTRMPQPNPRRPVR